MRFLLRRIVSILSLTVSAIYFLGCAAGPALSPYEMAQKAALDTVKAGRFDGGRMWTFDYPPLDYFQEAYGFRPDQKWMDDVRLSALRFANYCSASFVSGDGLLMTNHHCARMSVEEVSKEGEHLIEKGFWAPTLDDERKVPNLYVEQLIEIRDVTSEVISAMEAAKTDEEKITARRQKISEIEKRVGDETKLRANVTTLYNGGKYALYIYKRYNDIRLVFAPELALGFFGGDYDNFTYPRYSFDCSFFRIYDEDGKPLKTDHYYKWSKTPVKENDLVFVIGNPGRTGRLNTTAQLEYNRDIQYPFIAGMLNDRVDILRKYAEKHPEQKEEMINQIFNITNSQKAYNGQLSGLRNNELMQRRRDFDKKFRAAVMAKPELSAKYGHVWDEIAEARQKLRKIAPDFYALRFSGMAGMGSSDFFAKAGNLVKYAVELEKSEADRAKPYQGKALDLTKRSLLKASAADRDMEELSVIKQLEMMKRWLGADDPVVTKAFNGMSSESAAKRLISGTILSDSLKIMELVEKGPEAIMNSSDPFIALARMATPRFERASKVVDEKKARDEVNKTLLGRALFDVYGTSIPPDATLTLRIADGVVKGYEYNGTKAPAYTTFYGMYDRHYSFPGEESWGLPERWLKPPAEFKLSTPLNFSSTNDIIGGNSGSPMINKNKEIVGLIFDGNIESLPGDFIFAEDMNNRTVSVHSAGMLESIRHIYKAARLANELEKGKILQ